MLSAAQRREACLQVSSLSEWGRQVLRFFFIDFILARVKYQYSGYPYIYYCI